MADQKNLFADMDDDLPKSDSKPKKVEPGYVHPPLNCPRMAAILCSAIDEAGIDMRGQHHLSRTFREAVVVIHACSHGLQEISRSNNW